MHISSDNKSNLKKKKFKSVLNCVSETSIQSLKHFTPLTDTLKMSIYFTAYSSCIQ